MAIKSIRNKITNMASSEKLGEIDERSDNEEDKPKRVATSRPKRNPKPKQPKKKKPKAKKEAPKPKHKKKKVSKPPKVLNKTEETKPEVKEETEVDNEDVELIEGEMEGYEDVLSMLGIKRKVDLEVDFKSDDLDYVEFSQTTPLGFDFDEVTDFISRAKYTLDKLETALKQRNVDLVRVASEVKKVEQKMVEQNQKKELERMVGGMTEEERLIEENMSLKVELNELEGRLTNNGDGGETGKLVKEIEALKSENEMLRMSAYDEDEEGTSNKKRETLGDSKTSSLPGSFEGLPNIDDYEPENDKSPSMPELNDDSDSLDDMMKYDIGGMYDEEE